MNMTYRRRMLLSTIGFVILLTCFYQSPVQTYADSRWVLPTSMSFLRGAGGDLSEYAPIIEKQGFLETDLVNGKRRSIFPIGTSVLSTPAVLFVSLFNSAFEPGLRTHIPQRTATFIACIYGALAGVLFFWLVFERFSHLWIAASGTVIFCFCTSIWSTATRGLWQHGPCVLMIVIALLLLQRARQKPELVQYISIPLAMAFVIRPLSAIPITVLSIYILIFYRKWIIRYVLWSLVIAAPWIAFNFHIYGYPLPPYFLPNRITGSPHVAEALIGNLISPSRGLFIFSPVLFLSLSGFYFAIRNENERWFATLLGVIVVLHWIAISRFGHWWAGHSFGPRFMTDVLPYLVYLLCFNFAKLNEVTSLQRKAILSMTLVLGLFSALVHGSGAFSVATAWWNVLPVNIDTAPYRLWDWSDPQFARGWPFFGFQK